jgi:hypothetical protein
MPMSMIQFRYYYCFFKGWKKFMLFFFFFWLAFATTFKKFDFLDSNNNGDG